VSDLTAVSLFAGIGGFELALRRAGVRVTASVEIDPACRGVLRRHFPESKIFNDVTEVTGEQLRAAGFVPGRGVLCFGWPCQGNSVAGRRKGMADPRSGLWRHVVRLVAETRPRWLVGENVPGLLSVNGGRDFGAVLGDLDDLGYGVAWRVLDAQFFGVPQRRRRVIVVGCLGDPSGPVEVLLEPEGGGGYPPASSAARPGAAGASSDGTEGARTVGTLGTAGPGGGWRVGADEAAAGQLVAGTLGSRVGGSRSTDLDGHGAYIASTLQGGGRRGHRIDAEGAAGGHLIPFDAARIAHPENRANPQAGDPAPSIAATGQPMIARAFPVAFRGRDGGSQGECGEPGDPAFTVRTPGGGSSYPMIAETAAVRRLTPVECERLQGFPDDWTRRLDDGSEQSDSARYRECGNAVAVPVAEWIARRTVAVDQATAAERAA
jgi:DNA (cytosine-5)-methyltransferase 1